MDYYEASSNVEDEKFIEQQLMNNNGYPPDWPTKLMDAQVWPKFLWRNHPIAQNWSSPNQCMPIQASFPELVDMLPVQLLFSFLYLIIWLAAILGNAAVLYVVTLKQVQVSSVRSVFICSLAASDILMSMTSLPITAVSIFTRDWVFPSPFCKLMGIFQGGTVFVSSFTLTAIAVDRYILIKYPTKQKIKFRNAISIVAGLWVLGYACALPVGVFSSTVEYYPFCGKFCEENWPDMDASTGQSRQRKLYGLLVLIVQFGLPMLISTLCYWQIGRLIQKQMQRRSERQVVILQESKDRMRNQKNKTTRMMATMVAGLVLAWLPMNLINLWRDFNSDNTVNESNNGIEEEQLMATGGVVEGQTEIAWFSLIFAACHSIAMTSAVWNPIIYSFFNPQFKDTIRMALERRRQSQAAAALMTNNLANNTSNNLMNPTLMNGCDYSRRPSARSLLTTFTTTAFGGGNSTARNSIFMSPTKNNKKVILLNKTTIDMENDEEDCVEIIPGQML